MNSARGRAVGPATMVRPEVAKAPDSERTAHLIQLSKPVRVGELSITEFLECAELGGRCRNPFALRVDGDSMHPSLSHGDLVILAPGEAAQAGHAAVVQLRNQVGVTCKLFYSDKTHVRLIPINERYRPSRHPLNEVVWSLAVRYRVRLQP